MKPINKEAISTRIKQLRKEKNMTLEEWSALFGSNKSAGSKWENGTIPYKKTLDRMAEIGEKSVDWILFGTFTDYITDFIKQFPSIYNEIIKWEGEEYFSNKAKILTDKGKTYGDDEAIILELLSDRYNRDYFIRQDEFLDYLKNLSLKISDINPVDLDTSLEENSLIYRFSLIHKVNELLLRSKRIDEIKDLEIQGFPKEIDTFETMLEYLLTYEKLFSELKVRINTKASEEVQELQRKTQIYLYFQAALVTKEKVLHLMDGYDIILNDLAKVHDVDISDINSKIQFSYRIESNKDNT